jgi:putative colanic acid biosynthesis acetyltransferase WcaF
LKVDLSSYNNRWYKKEIGAPGLKQFIWYYTNIIFLRSHFNPLGGIKIFLLRLFGAKIGRGVVVKQGVSIKYPWKFKAGDHCWIGENVWIDNLAEINIGNHVCLSQGAMLLTGNHDYKKPSFDLIVKPIILEDGVWIGAQALVCPGVNCKTHAVLAAKSVAVADLEAYKIYQGNPAVAVRDRIIS